MGVIRVNLTDETYALLPHPPISRNHNETLSIQSVSEFSFTILILLFISILLFIAIIAVCVFECYEFVKRCIQSMQT